MTGDENPEYSLYGAHLKVMDCDRHFLMIRGQIHKHLKMQSKAPFTPLLACDLFLDTLCGL